MSEKKILVVEDDNDLREGLSITLTAAGFHVTQAQDAAVALMLIQKEQPHLILLDIGLPWGGGFLVMDRYAAKIPTIVLTANNHPMQKQQAMTAGAIDFFEKPADNQKLIHVIRKTLQDIK